MASSDFDIGTACRDNEFVVASMNPVSSQESKGEGTDFRDHEGIKASVCGLPTPKKLFACKESTHDEKDNLCWSYGDNSIVFPQHKKISFSNKQSVGKDKMAVSPPNPLPSDPFSGKSLGPALSTTCCALLFFFAIFVAS
jgi:hypothetical protein